MFFGHDEVKLISILKIVLVGIESGTGVARFKLWLFSLNFEQSKSYSGKQGESVWLVICDFITRVC